MPAEMIQKFGAEAYHAKIIDGKYTKEMRSAAPIVAPGSDARSEGPYKFGKHRCNKRKFDPRAEFCSADSAGLSAADSRSIACACTRPISPATLIYAPEDALLPIVVSPFIVPTSLAALSRIFQLGWIISHKSSQRTNPVYLSGTYASLLATRCASGFFFSRSVGWAYPSLFSHAALYEPLFGFGPLLIGAILLDDLSDGRQMAQRLFAVAGLALMDEAPWSYVCGTLLAGIYRLAQSYAVEDQSVQKYSTLPSWFAVEGREDPDTKLYPLSRSRILTLTLLGTLHIPHYQPHRQAYTSSCSPSRAQGISHPT
ncbi:hypothetical protein NM688_g9340 [Phlebia brevispora]|uniref:Uncharacterized protein n=1 Tax=Phlebia brevispora TaxID=194682 RepID=A0ACC1RGU8_9APHY|nr:hypothetical protein NM688_g9340 [Phlebia brevispora]